MNEIERITGFAREIRIAELEMFGHLGFGHIGGALSVTDLLAVLYGGEMRYDPKNPRWEQRDRLIVSKGHAGPAVYAALSLSGFFPREMLFTLNQGGTNLPSHCDKRKTPGIDMTTGSLGQGFSAAVGIAMVLRRSESHVFAIVGDGECQEGQVWEAAMFAAQHRLERLILFVDYNGKQLDGYTEEITSVKGMAARFESFCWNTLEVDGHDIPALLDTVHQAKSMRNGKPTAVVLHTLKGKGAAFVENAFANHHMTVSAEQAQAAIEALRAQA